MADRPLSFQKLTRILCRYGVSVSRQRGSHVVFSKRFPEGEFSYPVPKRKDVMVCYVQGCRRKFRLTLAHGVTDEEFYG
jgi:predicted RNA binding protein YcfA (HicA-like mRNA interferase family)